MQTLFLHYMQQSITILGLPGSGKSFWGQKIAQHFEVPFYDLDILIVKESGLSIAKIFEEGGEELFRRIETNILWQLFDNQSDEKFILALGGGTPAFNNNMTIIVNHSKSIYINIDIETIAQQLIDDKQSHRPLVNKSNLTDLKNNLSKVIEERKPFYELADYMIFQNELSLANFEKIIKDINTT